MRCRLSLFVAAWFAAAPAAALTDLLYDSEPNDAPHQAVTVKLPSGGKDRLRIVGELTEGDQDAYRLVVDEDLAGKRWSLQLNGRGGALTQLDVFDFTGLADGRNRIPAELSEKPAQLHSIATDDGSRPARADAMLLAPGVYVLGISHSGGRGAYSIELAEWDSARVEVIDEPTSAESPRAMRTRGRHALWTQGETWLGFEIDEEQAEQSWDLTFQSALGHRATLSLQDGDGTELLAAETTGGLPLERHALQLAPGEYRLRTEQKPAGVQLLSVVAGAPAAADGRETEPNDRQPNVIEPGDTIAGHFDENDREWLAFTITPDHVGRRFDLELATPDAAQPELCLVRDAERLSHCTRGADGITALRDLALSAGTYRLRLHERRDLDVDWQLEWLEREPLRAGEEAEPNDDIERAAVLHERGFGRGRFVGDETDHWRFSVTGEPQLYRIQLQGEDLFGLSLKSMGGRELKSERARSNQRVRLDNVYLLPGEYLAAARGEDSDYILRVVGMGPPPSGMELEPNDDVANARQLQPGVEHFGTLAESGDEDRYRFTLSGYERIRLTVQPPVDGGIRGRLEAGDDPRVISDLRYGNDPGRTLSWDMYLPPGDYSLGLSPGQPSDAEYTVHYQRLDYLDRIADREPNDDPRSAAPLPETGLVTGDVGNEHRKEDWYRLPETAAPTALALPRPDDVKLALFADPDSRDDLLEWDRDAEVYRARIDAGRPHWLRVEGSATYELDLTALATAPAPGAAEPLELDVEVDAPSIQAFSPWAQRLAGRFVIHNPSDRPRSVRLETHLTDAGWQLTPDRHAVTIPAGQAESVAFNIYVPPDALTTPPVRLSARVHDDAGAGRVMHTIAADTDAAPVNPLFHWEVPESLRGSLNAAATNLGARAVASPNVKESELEDMARLFDGLTRVGLWTEFKIPAGRRTPDELPQPTVDLAGDDPVPVTGFLINPTAATLPHGFLKDFAVSLSLDGTTFERVLTGTLEPVPREQAFALDSPVSARFARLEPLSSHFPAAGYGAVRLGEFKVLAQHGWRPDPAPFNLADPALGGHLVWAQPWVRGGAFEHSLLVPGDDKAPDVRLQGASELEVVLGFHHARRAAIDAVSILPLAGGREDRRPRSVQLAVADDSPLGPWRTVAEGDLGATEQRIPLDSPQWARYLKLTFGAPEGARHLQLPDRIAVYEATGTAASIVGEWGHYQDAGPYEAEHTPRWQGLAGTPGNVSRDSALPLQAESPVSGRALLDRYSAWYRLDVPAPNNQLTLTLAGTPTLEAKPRLLSEAGETVELFAVENTASETRWQAYVTPGESYFLEVAEPPRSVIFSWDTSGSVAAYLPTITNALLTYAETIEPGRDEVNLLPFGRGGPLLANWQGHAYPLMQMLVAYPQETSSSAAEATLAAAAREMVDRPGKKAVLLLTDAATTTDAALWPALEAGQPQVFAMKLSSEGAFGGDPNVELDLMQDWARVRGGHFEYVTNLGVLSRGFDRAVARLKRPVDFTVAAAYATVENPEPASLTVIAGSGGLDAEARGAVEIILDASGSMLKRLDGERRIAIAKDAIRNTVQNTLPDGIPIALRVYGHKEAGACRTDLEMPLGALDKAAFLDRLDDIQAVNLAKTPIADSLAAVSSDLADAEGRRLVVLLTDGEETCDGDPAAEIAKIREQGYDVRVNIVGFAIDDEALKDSFRAWAELGGGEYLDAAAPDTLGAALDRALQVPFTVLNASGETVAEGIVGGDAVELPPGRYGVRVESSPPVTHSDIRLGPGDAREIELQ